MDACLKLQQAYQSVMRNRKLSSTLKAQILSGIVQQLRLLVKNSPNACNSSKLKSELTQTNATICSHLSLLSMTSMQRPMQRKAKAQIERLQKQIIEKQKKKLWLDEEIEETEEDSFESQKVLFIKRDICQQLDQKISRMRYQMSKDKHQEEKKGLSQRLLNFFKL